MEPAKGHSTKNTDNPMSASMLALPAEIMFKIFGNSSLTDKDLANLRRVCKWTNLCATEAFAKERFKKGLRLDFYAQEFERLAAIYSSNLAPFLECVHFVRNFDLPSIRAYPKAHPDYSALKNIDFESSLSDPGSPSALEELLGQAKHLETFSFSTYNNPGGIDRMAGYYYDRGRERKIRDREQVDAIFSKLNSDRLTELNLAHVIFSVRTLKALLERHCGTIRKLSFLACGLRRGSCAGLLLWISQNLPCLEEIELRDVYETAWGAFTYVVVEMVKKSGKESIKAYVASLQKQNKS
ncbi:hypothetical protein KCU81_g8518, partial [Aureobasidium melanogenum]|uniref:F-box domain-containing protein n=1 Tax=Aureobasidium melanogenum (strain CBS 110374) TaxID=1043003 RepID=A0A074W2E1_AURM1